MDKTDYFINPLGCLIYGENFPCMISGVVGYNTCDNGNELYLMLI